MSKFRNIFLIVIHYLLQYVKLYWIEYVDNYVRRNHRDNPCDRHRRLTAKYIDRHAYRRTDPWCDTGTPVLHRYRHRNLRLRHSIETWQYIGDYGNEIDLHLDNHCCMSIRLRHLCNPKSCHIGVSSWRNCDPSTEIFLANICNWNYLQFLGRKFKYQND